MNEKTATILGYRELSRRFKKKIQAGDYKTGEMLPPLRTIADDFGVSPRTAHRASQELEQQGLVKCIPRKGWIVVGNPEEIEASQYSSKVRQILNILPKSFVDFMETSWSPSIDDWTGRIFMGIQHECISRKLRLITEALFDRDQFQKMVAAGEFKEISGVVCFLNDKKDIWFVEELDKLKIPWVTYARRFGMGANQTPRNYVVANNIDAGRKIGQAFAYKGYKKVFYLCREQLEGEGQKTDVEKFNGLIDAYITQNLPIDGITCSFSGGYEIEDGYDAFKKIFKQYGKPDAVFAAGDHLAMGVIKAIKGAGLKTPDDIPVVGSTGLSCYAQSSPSLTCVAQPMDQIGRQAIQIINKMIDDQTMQIPGEKITGPLIIRDSFKLTPQEAEEIGIHAIF